MTLTSRLGCVVLVDAGHWDPCAHALVVLREKRLLREAYNDDYFLTEKLKLTNEEFFIPFADMSQAVKSGKDIIVLRWGIDDKLEAQGSIVFEVGVNKADEVQKVWWLWP